MTMGQLIFFLIGLLVTALTIAFVLTPVCLFLIDQVGWWVFRLIYYKIAKIPTICPENRSEQGNTKTNPPQYIRPEIDYALGFRQLVKAVRQYASIQFGKLSNASYERGKENSPDMVYQPITKLIPQSSKHNSILSLFKKRIQPDANRTTYTTH